MMTMVFISHAQNTGICWSAQPRDAQTSSAPSQAPEVTTRSWSLLPPLGCLGVSS